MSEPAVLKKRFLPWKIITAFVLAIAATVILSINLYLNSNLFQDRIRRFVNNAVPGSVQWKDWDISVESGQVLLNNVVIEDVSHKKILSLETARIKIRPAALLKKELYLTQIEIHNVKSHFVIADDGRLNLMDALVSKTPEKDRRQSDSENRAFNIIFKKVKIRNADLDIRIPDKHFLLTAQIPIIDLTNFAVNSITGKLSAQAQKIQYNASDFYQEIEQLGVEARIANQSLIVKNVRLDAKEGNLKLSGRIENVFSSPRMNLKLKSGIRLAPSANRLGLKNRFSGKLNAMATLQGLTADPEATLSLSSDALEIFGFPIKAFRLNSNFASQAFIVNSAAGQTDFGKVLFSGKMDIASLFSGGKKDNQNFLGNTAYQGKASIENTDVHRFFPAQSPIKGTASTHLTFQGTGFDLKQMKMGFQVQTKISELPSAQSPPEESLTASISGRIENGAVTLPAIEIKGFGADLTGTAEYGFDSENAKSHINLELADLKRFAWLTGTRVLGNLSLTGDLAGPLDRPGITVNFSGNNLAASDLKLAHLSGKAAIESIVPPAAGLSLKGNGISYKGVHADQVDIVSKIADNRLVIDHITAVSRGSKLFAKGGLNVFEPGSPKVRLSDLNLDLVCDPIDLNDFQKEASGSLKLTGHVTGKPDDFQGRFSADGNGIRLYGQKIDTLKARAEISNDTVQIYEIKFSIRPGAAARGNGWVRISDRTLNAEIRTRDFPLNTLETIREKIGDPGIADLDLQISGSIDNPTAKANLAIRDMKIQDESVPPITLSSTLSNRVVHFKSRFNGDWSAFFNLDDKRFGLDLKTRGLKLSPYMRMAGNKDFSGELSGRLTLEGVADNPKTLHADLDLKGLSLFFRQAEVFKSEQVRFKFENGLISTPGINFVLFQKGSGQAAIEHRQKDGQVFVVRVNLPLSQLDPVFEQISDSTGWIRANIRIPAKIEMPEINGTLNIENAGMAIEGQNNAFSGVSGKVHFSKDRIASEGITGLLGGGRFRLSGSAKLDAYQIKDAMLALDCEQVPIDVPQTMDLKIDGKLALKGNMEKSVLSGRLFLTEGLYYRDVKLDIAGFSKSGPQVKPELEKALPLFLNNMTLAVEVDKKEPFQIENNLASMAVSPDLTLHGTFAHPLISGRAQVESGMIRFQKKEFEIQKGVIDFLDPYRIVPVIDLEARTDIRSWQIDLKLSGPPDNLDFSLKSDPEEAHADILSLIAVGKTTRELRSSQGGSNFSPTQILAGFLAETVAQNLKDQSGLDQVDISVGSSEDGKTDTGSVVLGKELSRRLSIKYGVEISGGENLQRVSSDYRIFEALIMNAYQDSAGDFGGGIKLRLEF